MTSAALTLDVSTVTATVSPGRVCVTSTGAASCVTKVRLGGGKGRIG